MRATQAAAAPNACCWRVTRWCTHFWATRLPLLTGAAALSRVLKFALSTAPVELCQAWLQVLALSASARWLAP